MESLKWPALELHRKIARLSFFHKIIHNLLHTAHSPSSYITSAHTPSISIAHLYNIFPLKRVSFPGHVQLLTAWNNLPDSLSLIIKTDSLDPLANPFLEIILQLTFRAGPTLYSYRNPLLNMLLMIACIIFNVSG